MQFKIQLTIMNPENGRETTKEIISLNKQNNRLEDIGLSLAESKSTLKALQEKITEYQCDDFVESHWYSVIFSCKAFRVLFDSARDRPMSSNRLFCLLSEMISFVVSLPFSGFMMVSWILNCIMIGFRCKVID